MGDSKERIILFGDESHSNEIVTYSFLIVPTQNMPAVELAIKNTKKKYALDEDTRLHCREIFNESAKKKTAFADFAPERLFSFLQDLASAFFLAGGRGWVGYLDTKGIPERLRVNWSHNWRTHDWDINDIKLKMLFCYQAACVPITHILPPPMVKAYVDGDKTKVIYIDEKKRQVDTLREFFPVNHDNRKISPEPIHGTKPAILDLADLLAYSSARGLTKAALKNKPHFISITKIIDPGYSEVKFDHPENNGAMFAVRSYDPGDRVKNYVCRFIDAENQ